MISTFGSLSSAQRRWLLGLVALGSILLLGGGGVFWHHFTMPAHQWVMPTLAATATWRQTGEPSPTVGGAGGVADVVRSFASAVAASATVAAGYTPTRTPRPPTVTSTPTITPTPTDMPTVTATPTLTPTATSTAEVGWFLTPQPTLDVPFAVPLWPPASYSWPAPLAGQTASKLGIHVVRNADANVMEYVRRVKPRVVKAVGDIGWMKEIKSVSPDTMLVGRLMDTQNEYWVETIQPAEAAHRYVAAQIGRYRLNPWVDYWEGWNEFVAVTPAQMQWYAEFEAERACLMHDLGLHAAVGGFAAGTPEYAAMELFLPALEAARRCGAIFTLHEVVMPLIGCGVGLADATDKALIPGAPLLANVRTGSLMLRYRYWYEGYLKPRGLGDIPLVISELAVGGLLPDSWCNGPGGAAWKLYRQWWVQQGVGPDGPRAYVNLLAWYDWEIRHDPYVWGVAIFTAGAVEPQNDWYDWDLQEVLLPLAYYAAGVR